MNSKKLSKSRQLMQESGNRKTNRPTSQPTANTANSQHSQQPTQPTAKAVV